MKLLIAISLLLSAVFCLPSANADQITAVFPKQSQCFEFQSSMWVNLHHHLYQQAKTKKSQNLLTPDVTIDPSEQAILEAAIDFYKNNYVEFSLLFNDSLGDIKVRLSHQPDNKPLSDKMLPPILSGHLNATAAIYQKYYWSNHNKENKRWISNTKNLLKTHFVNIKSKLETQFNNPLCQTLIRFDIVAADAHWAGAYTTITPAHVVITSTRTNNQNLAALEMSFHEAAHVSLLDHMKVELSAIEKTGSYKHEQGLWHAILFYTVGEITRQSYLAMGINNYQPYAYKRGLYKRIWSKYEALIVKYWQPYLDNKTTMKVALTAILDALQK